MLDPLAQSSDALGGAVLPCDGAVLLDVHTAELVVVQTAARVIAVTMCARAPYWGKWRT